MWLTAYGCSSAGGPGTKVFWKNLLEGKSSPLSLTDSAILKSKNPPLTTNYKIHLRRDLPSTLTHRERIGKKLIDAWHDLTDQWTQPSGTLGIILASTKGFSEDVVWKMSLEAQAVSTDTLTPLIDDFLNSTNLKVVRQKVVSNACSSSAAALKLAQTWLAAKTTDHVLILSADTVGEFVVRGFHSLQALTAENHATPFDKNRSGLQLGEAAAALWLSRDPLSDLHIGPVGLNCEGVAATRPDEEGRSLYLALVDALKNKTDQKPNLIVAHGTGTALNDSTEDFVFHALYNGATSPLITGTKWSIGHTLGASCAMDLIAAAECLKNKKVFGLPFLKNLGESFKGRFAAESSPFDDSSVLVSSLGFGGVHAGVCLSSSKGDL